MSQKKIETDRGSETMRWFVAARTARQLDWPKSETQSAMGPQMDRSVSQRRKDMVCGSLQETAQDRSTCKRLLRALGHPNPCQAQGQGKSSWILWSGGNLRRADRPGNPPLAQHPHNSSHFVSSPAVDPQAPGPVSEGADPALSNCPSTERCTPVRLHCGALPGFSASRGDLEPQGYGDGLGLWNRGARSESPACSDFSPKRLAKPWYPKISADGQRYEPDGRADASAQSRTTCPVLSGLPGHCAFHPRATARFQCLGRALQRTLAGEGLAAVSIPHAWATAGALQSFPRRLQQLPQTKVDTPRQEGSVQDTSAISSQAYAVDSPYATVSWSNLVYPQDR